MHQRRELFRADCVPPIVGRSVFSLLFVLWWQEGEALNSSNSGIYPDVQFFLDGGKNSR